MLAWRQEQEKQAWRRDQLSFEVGLEVEVGEWGQRKRGQGRKRRWRRKQRQRRQRMVLGWVSGLQLMRSVAVVVSSQTLGSHGEKPLAKEPSCWCPSLSWYSSPQQEQELELELKFLWPLVWDLPWWSWESSFDVSFPFLWGCFVGVVEVEVVDQEQQESQREEKEKVDQR